MWTGKPSKLHDVISQKTRILISTAMKTSNMNSNYVTLPRLHTDTFKMCFFFYNLAESSLVF